MKLPLEEKKKVKRVYIMEINANYYILDNLRCKRIPNRRVASLCFYESYVISAKGRESIERTVDTRTYSMGVSAVHVVYTIA